MTRILQVNGDARLRQMIVDLVARSRQFALVGDAAGREEALAGLAHGPDVVLLTLEAELSQAALLVREMACRQPAIRILLCCRDFTLAHRTLCRAPRVRGSLSADCPTAELRLALREVAAGREYWSGRCLRTWLRLDWLSRRESEILDLVAIGFADPQIALELGIAPNTVKTYLGRLQNRLGVSGRTQLQLAAVRRGLLPAARRGVAYRHLFPVPVGRPATEIGDHSGPTDEPSVRRPWRLSRLGLPRSLASTRRGRTSGSNCKLRQRQP